MRLKFQSCALLFRIPRRKKVIVFHEATSELSHLIQQSTKLRIWARSRLWAQVLIAMVIGVGMNRPGIAGGYLV